MILAIYVLVLQALFGALAQGNAVGAQLLAAELGVLCGPTGHQTGGADDQRDHDDSCCVNVCRLAGVGPAVQPTVGPFAPPAPVESAEVVPQHASALSAPSLRMPPARGPPTAG